MSKLNSELSAKSVDANKSDSGKDEIDKSDNKINNSEQDVINSSDGDINKEKDEINNSDGAVDTVQEMSPEEIEKLDRSIKSKVKRENFVGYPVENWDSFLETSREYFLKRYFSRMLKKCNFRKSDFNFLHTIWQGKYSRVFLSLWCNDNYVAVKIRDKKSIIVNRQLIQAKREIRLLNFIKFPFILHACVVQDNVYLYYIMSFACGNNLKHLITNRILEENEVKFYGGQVIFCLEFLHSIGVVHRNLESANVLICHDGYVKLSGFSHAKIGLGRQKSLMYIDDIFTSPDIFNEKHGYPYDIFCLGVLLYNMSSGDDPFRKTKGTVFTYFEVEKDRIVIPPFPDFFSNKLKDLLSRLLDTDQCNRLGAKCPSEIKSHDWFDSFPWNDLANKRIRPPFIPKCYSDLVGCFQTFPMAPLVQASYDPYDLQFRDCFD